MKKLLVIVDMQNDFVTGALKNKDAKKIIKKIGKVNSGVVSDYKKKFIMLNRSEEL